MVTEDLPHWSGARESGGRWQLRFMRWVALTAPAWLIDPMLWLISFGYALNTRRLATQGSILYLRKVLGREPSFRDRHRHARTFAHVFLDRVRLLAGGVDGFRVDATREELIGDLYQQGRGAVLLGAHFGSFEALRAFDRVLPGLSVRYLMFPDHAPHSTELLRELNPEVADKVISLANGQHAMMEVYEALEQGEFVAFLGDRIPNPAIRAKVSVPFFGGDINVPTSPYIAAMAAKVPLILCTAPRIGKDHYAVEFTEFYDGARVTRAERSNVINGLARRYVETLEGLCRRHPYNWFNFFDIWRD